MATEVPETKMDLVAKEIELTKLLASNDPRTRCDGIKQIKQLLIENSEDKSDAFQLNDYLIIWKGLFNFMWTSDKPVPQESETEILSYLIHSCTSYQGKILFLDAFFLTIKDNWMSIRQHRIDTCMMWVRHCLKQLLFTFVNCDWNLEYMNKFSEVLYRALKSFTPSLKTQLQVIFLEELAEVSRGKVPTEALVIILDSFLHYISELNDFMLIREVTQNVFRNLLSPLPDLETLEAKFQASQKIIGPSNSNNDLELVEDDIAKNKSNELNDNPLDPQAGNLSVEIPRINFNPKDVAKVLNKYLTEVDCTRKCLWEINKLIQFYNRLGACILPNRPNDLKINSQVLKHKKKKYLSNMVKDGVKKLEKVDLRIKKSGLEVHDHKSLKEINKIGDIIVERGKIGKFMWKVRHFDNVNTLKENYNVNGSWTVSKETIIDGTNTVCINDDKPPTLVPPGFNVEVLVFQEKIPTKVQNKVSLTPNFKCLTYNSSLKERNSNKRKSKSKITQINDGPKKKYIKKQNSRFIQISTPNTSNATNKNSLSLLVDHEVSKKIKNSIEATKSVQSVNASPFKKTIFSQDNKSEEKNQIKDDLPLLAPAGYNVEVSEAPEIILTKLQKKDSLNPNFKCSTVDSSLKEINSNKRISKSKITKMNVGSKKKYIKKQNSRFIQIGTPNSSNATNKNRLSLSVDHEVSKKIKNSIEAAKSVQSVNASPFKKTIFSQDNKSEEKNQIKDDSPLLATAGYNVEVSETPEKILTKLLKKDSLNPNSKFVTVDSSLKESNSNKHKSKSQITQMNDGSKEKNIKKQNSLFIKIGTPNALNTNHKKSLSISADHGGSVSKSIKNNIESAKAVQFLNAPSINITPDNKIGGKNQIDDEPPFQVPAEFNVEVPETLEKILTKPQKKVSLNPNFKSVSVDSTLKELTKMGEIVKGGKIGKSVLKVRKSDKINTLKENFNLNGSWRVSVSKDTKIDGNNTMCINDGEQPLMVPVGFNVEVLETLEKTVTKLQKKVSSTPSLTCPSVDSSIKELNKLGEIVLERRKIGKSMWKVIHFDNVNILKENFNLNGSWTVSKETIIECTNTVCINDDKPTLVPPGFNVEILESPEKTSIKVQNKVSLTPSLTPLTVDTSKKPKEKSIQKSNSPLHKICSPNIVITSHNSSWYLSADNDGSASNKIKESNPSIKVQKSNSLTSVTTPDKSSKSLKCQTDEQRVLPQTTTTFSKNKPDGKNTGTPISKVKETSATRLLQKCRKTIAGEEISLLKPEDISNKALEKVQSKAFEDGFGSLRKSPRLSIQTTRELQKCRKTIAGEEISLLKPEDISNKALEKVRNEAFEDGFDSLKKSPRLSIQTTRELQKCRKTIAGEEISLLKPEDISNKALEKVRNEAFEDGFDSLKKSPRLSIQTTRELQKCRKTIAGEEISLLKPEDISNKALEKVRNEAFEDGFGSLRKSPRLSIQTTRELQKCRKTIAGEEISLLKPEDISNKALEKVRSKAFEDGFGSLRKSPRLSIQATRKLQKCRKTTAGEEISLLKPEDISNKALEKVQSKAFEDGFGSLRKSPRLSIQTTRELQKCRKTIAGEEISLLKPEDISNKALEKVRNEAFEDGFGSLRKSPRLSIQTTRELQKCMKTIAGEEISLLKPEDISNKALEKVRSKAFEDGFGSLRKSPRLSIQTTRELQKCRKTTAGEEISLLKPEDISNKALEKVRNEAFEDGFGSLRKSPRLSIKTDSAKK